jgi:hypothetical protein
MKDQHRRGSRCDAHAQPGGNAGNNGAVLGEPRERRLLRSVPRVTVEMGIGGRHGRPRRGPGVGAEPRARGASGVVRCDNPRAGLQHGGQRSLVRYTSTRSTMRSTSRSHVSAAATVGTADNDGSRRRSTWETFAASRAHYSYRSSPRRVFNVSLLRDVRAVRDGKGRAHPNADDFRA